MKARYRILGASLAFGLLAWTLDALLDRVIFCKGSFLDLMILRVPAHELYMRSLVVGCFLIFGLAVSAGFSRRKRVQEALRQSRSFLQTVIDAIPESTIVVDRDCRIALANRAARELAGGNDPAASGLTCHQVSHHRDTPCGGTAHPCPLEQVVATKGPVMVTHTHYDAEGNERVVEVTAAPIFDEAGEVAQIIEACRDITERVRAEEALRSERDKLQSLMDGLACTGIGIDIVRTDYEILYQNQTLENRFDRSPGKPCYETYMGLEQPCDFCPMLKATSTGHVEGTDLTALDGRQYELVSVPLPNPDGTCDKAIEVIRDITERKRVEEALRESENKNRTLLENLPQKIFLKDRNSVYVSCNENYARDLGIKAAEIAGRTDYDFHPRELADKYSTDDKRIVESGETEEIDETYIQEGQERIVRTVKTPVTDAQGNVVGVLGVFWDITDRKRAEEELKESEERHRALFEGACEGILVAEAETMLFKYANPALCKMLGYSRDELVGMGVADIHPKDDLERAVAEFEATVRGDKVVADDIPCLRKDGTVIYADISTASALIDGRQCNVGFFTDITERRCAEEERRELEARVQHAQKLESLGMLAGGIAHDFNNLLACILGNADLALTELPAASPARDNVEEIRTASRRAADLTRQMLAYSGKGRYVVAALDLNELVREMAHLLRASISKKAVLTFDLTDNLPAAEADAAQIQQVVMNLITNASDAIGDVPGAITLRTGVMEPDAAFLAQCYAADGMAAQGRCIFLDVSDTGRGMDAETLARVFDPFFTTKFAGRGLGLAAVLGIVRAHGGAIKLDSEPGKGTRFRVLFPASERSAERPAPSAPRRAWKGAGTMLVVDDEQLVGNVAKRILEHAGFDVLIARKAAKALELFRAHADRVAAVLLDMTMPEMSGEEVYRELRQIKPDVPVILTSGYSESDALGRFDGAGLAGFVHKPFEIDTLIGKARHALGQ